MKNRNFPNKDACWDYDASNCEGCAIGQKIEKFARKIKRLQAENAELRARLDKAVELKAKVGDVIYMPWEYDGSDGVATLSIIGSDFHNDEFIYITDLESDSAYYLEKYKLGIFRNEDFDSIVFTDRSEAEARLAELRGRT